ncbi:MAG: hypothetical protein QOF73_1729 [Thermomicrobiales bacterium]|nr:hypothetical protein [Thermomicrobiales bacterium]
MNDIGRAHGAAIGIQQVVTAWALATHVSHGSPGGASPAALAEAERTLGRALPPAARDLYAAYDGGDFIGGNINLLPLHPTMRDILALTTASDLMREWRWEVPPELLIFGGNGSEVSYGLWLHEPRVPDPVVVAISEDQGLAVVGDSLPGFLAGHSAYYLLLKATHGYDLVPALDALGVPAPLRSYDPTDDGLYHRLLNWANPHLPDKESDPWAHRMTRDQINELARRRS